MRKNYTFLAAALLVIAIAFWLIARSRTFQVVGEIYPRVETEQKVVALTFDDGPTERTDSILAILRDLNIKATFFVMGKDLVAHPLEGPKLVRAGHELGNHTYSHNRMMFKTPAYTRHEIETTDSLIRRTGYQGEILFRPPYGKKFLVLPYYLNKTDRKTIMWDVEPESYRDVVNDTEKITQHVLERTKPGSIILLHVMYGDRNKSLGAIPAIVTGLQRRGYVFKTVSELLRYETETH
ncbi:polysaccharide deacetylase family protein [Larkinella bovis]|uniref:Polysaccharide deacetylase family protein n=1 Tax=Larkinella bovis TaxID=683041 RepID=A0ABW0IDI4_9BACT